jgi:hypothetical protein
MSVEALGDPSASLKPSVLPKVKFKRFKRQQADDRVRPAIVVAQRAARIAVDALELLPPFESRESDDPSSIRREILRCYPSVDLSSLL